MIRRALSFLLASLILWLPVGASAQTQTPAPAAQNAAVAEADRLFMSGKVAEASARYQTMVSADPSFVPAQVGLIRTYMVLQRLDDALVAVNAALALQPNSPLLLLTLGDLQFRLGKIPEAERSYIKSQNLDPKDAASYIGLTRIYRAYSLYRRAYDQMQRAHQIAPGDVAVQLLWVDTLPAPDKIAAVKAYLAGPGALYPQVARVLQQVLDILQQNANVPQHACRLVSNVQETNTKLYSIPKSGMQLGAVGLTAKLNKEELHLAVDTGASGILIGRLAAEKAGLKRLNAQQIGGLGDTGQQGGYTALADRIRVGDLEFEDCVVRVTEAATPVTGQDGLIGANVFGSYLIDIDIPGARLRLSPLPKRPNEAAAPASLQTMQESAGLGTDGPAAVATSQQAAGLPSATLPQDAYVAPEMADWTKVYRFKHLLLVPTFVDRIGPMLFVLDTGSSTNVLSTRAARAVTAVKSDAGTHIRGLSGSVANVYRADKAALQFGRYEQQNQDIITLDLASMCKQTGTEVSGILGFAMLRILQIQIDYRDGLVNFIYDPHHLPKEIRISQ
jgi:tetratricopeptide (TPR) repeat protein